MVLAGVHGPIEPTCRPLLLLAALPYWILTPNLLTGPWNPLPLVTAIVSICSPSENESAGLISFPSTVCANSSFSSTDLPPIPHSIISGFFFGTLVSLGFVCISTFISVSYTHL